LIPLIEFLLCGCFEMRMNWRSAMHNSLKSPWNGVLRAVHGALKTLMCALIGLAAAPYVQSQALTQVHVQATCPVAQLMGLADEEGNIFLELPATRETCAARDKLMRENAVLARPGMPLYVAAATAGGMALSCVNQPFWVLDSQGRGREITLDRVAAIRRDDALDGKSEMKGACWYVTHAPTKGGHPAAAADVMAEESQWLLARPAISAIPLRMQQPLVDNWAQGTLATQPAARA
jgi:hypothetical protein